MLPFVFVTDPEGVGLLLSLTPDMTWLDVAWQVVLATAGLAALAAACQGYFLRALNGAERAGFTVAGLLLVFPALLEGVIPWLPAPHLIGMVLAAGLLALQGRGRVAA